MKVLVGFGENLEQSYAPLIAAGHEVISSRGRSKLDLAELLSRKYDISDQPAHNAQQRH